MTQSSVAKGSCLCGSVHFFVKNPNKSIDACHCGMCRKWGGGPFMTVDCGSNVTFEGEDNISIYDSSEWAERGFCKKCGSHLIYRLKESRQHMIPAGLFDNQEGFVFDLQVFIDKKPPYYCFANKTKNMTEAEVFEKYGSP